jgi:hypothetical protein
MSAKRSPFKKREKKRKKKEKNATNTRRKKRWQLPQVGDLTPIAYASRKTPRDNKKKKRNKKN